MQTKSRPIIKITNIAKIVPDKYPESPFPKSTLKLKQCTMSLILHSFSLKLCSATVDLKHSAVVQIYALTLVNQIIQGRGASVSKKVMRKI